MPKPSTQAINPESTLIPYLRILKGAPLTCLVVMNIFEGPVTQEFLFLATGYDYYVINQAMKLLRRFNLVTGSPRTSWSLVQPLNEPARIDLNPIYMSNRRINQPTNPRTD